MSSTAAERQQPVFTIRSYQPGDWEFICAIHDAARLDELRGSCDLRAFIPLAQDPESEQLLRSSIFVAQVQDRVVGFSAVEGDYLGWLYVSPDCYRRGIGRALLRVAVERAGSPAWTVVLAGNDPAIALYRSEGFLEAARYASDNSGYPVTCLRLERRAPTQD